MRALARSKTDHASVLAGGKDSQLTTDFFFVLWGIISLLIFSLSRGFAIYLNLGFCGYRNYCENGASFSSRGGPLLMCSTVCFCYIMWISDHPTPELKIIPQYLLSKKHRLAQFIVDTFIHKALFVDNHSRGRKKFATIWIEQNQFEVDPTNQPTPILEAHREDFTANFQAHRQR